MYLLHLNRKPLSRKLLSLSMSALMALSAPVLAAEVDVDAAQALAKKSNCFKCHSVDKKKDGPSFKETAAKYKGKADAEDTLYKHATTGPKVKIDGKEEVHEIVKSKNEADIRNLVRFILSR